MKNTEAAYIMAGYKYEAAANPDAGRARAQALRHMLEQESIEDQTEARRLIEQGRAEARSRARTPA